MSEAAKTVAEYNALREKMEEMREKYAKEGKQYFKDGAKSLFDEFEEMKSFSWNQYTPYFNDGDPCRFSANIDYPTINGYNFDYGEGDDSEQCDAFRALPEERQRLIFDSVCRFLSQFNSEDYGLWFGDHAEVTVTSRGITVDHYSHD